MPTKYSLSREQLEDILKSVGVVIAGETASDLICYCCFHDNKDSPSFNIETRAPYRWKCWNGKCDKRGNIVSLLTTKGFTYLEAKKMLVKGATEVNDLVGLVNDLMGVDLEDYENKWEAFDPDKFRNLDEQHDFPVKDYLANRGIYAEAYDYFKLGFSPKKRMLTIPAFDERGVMMGVIGRSIDSKRYQISTGMAKGEIIWNANNAREYDSIILTEGALDAVYVWQAGFQNVGAILGSSISDTQWGIIRSNWSDVICFFDNDDAGHAARDGLFDKARDIGVSAVSYPDRLVVDKVLDRERHIKDPGELTHEEIGDMITNAKSKIELLLERSL